MFDGFHLFCGHGVYVNILDMNRLFMQTINLKTVVVHHELVIHKSKKIRFTSLYFTVSCHSELCVLLVLYTELNTPYNIHIFGA